MNKRKQRGAAKKQSTDPPVHLLNPRPIHHPTIFLDFFLVIMMKLFLFAESQTHQSTIRLFFLSKFLGVKTVHKIFLQKVHVKNFSQNNRQKLRCQCFLDFLCFIAFSGFSQRWEFKNATKTFCKKYRVEKCLQKIRPFFFSRLSCQKPIFFSICFITFLGVSR